MSATFETSGEAPLSKSAERALNLPVGMASPLWLLYAGAASAGMAYWFMTRWARPVNLEALLGREGAVAVAPVAEAMEAAVEVAETAAAAAVEEAETVAAEVEAALDEATAPQVSPEPEPLPEPTVEAAPAPEPEVEPLKLSAPEPTGKAPKGGSGGGARNSARGSGSSRKS